MNLKEKAKIKKEIKALLKAFGWKSESSTHSELAEFIIDEITTE